MLFLEGFFWSHQKEHKIFWKNSIRGFEESPPLLEIGVFLRGK